VQYHTNLITAAGNRRNLPMASTTSADLFAPLFFHGFVFCNMGIAELAVEE
jgi:hypothetical protein